jgi:peptidoglycan/xylan/chitin deacetylase (PgdA/CDA1 family)
VGGNGPVLGTDNISLKSRIRPLSSTVLSPLVVCYHAVRSGWTGSSAVSESVLAHQLSLLRRRGYAGFTFSELERLRRQGELPPRSVAITFDDGYESVLRARPLLTEAGYPATVFVVTQFVESGLPLRWPGIDHWLETEYASEMRSLSWDALESLKEAGWEIGSHTVTHARLPDLDDATLGRELAESRRTIVERLGVCRTLAYPYGVADARVAQAVAAAGYEAACTLSVSHRVDEPFRRPRTGVYDCDRAVRLRIKISPSLRYLRGSVAAPKLDAAVRAASRLP